MSVTLDALLAGVDDAELEDMFARIVGERAARSGREIRDLLRTRKERRQARVDAEAARAA